ncbi:MAG TPA: fibronectin/fibrinogen-binding protein [Peptococcaceae bacterium]|nr:fibronectin/fibrinogen-binding protein [Peptococcaceae bacterium]
MPFDGLALAAISRELATLLSGGRVVQVYENEAREIVTVVRRGKKKYDLLWSAHPQWARVHLTTHEPGTNESLSFFCTMLRRYLVGGRVVRLTQPNFERVLRFEVATHDDVGRPVTCTLVGEFMGRHANIILLDENATIIDARKRYTRDVSRYREVLPGLPYLAPPVTKENILSLDEEAFIDLLMQLPVETPVAGALQEKIDGLSTVTAREVVFRAGLALDARLEQCGAYEFSRLWTAARSLFEAVARGDSTPTLLLAEDGTPLDFAPDDLSHIGAARRIASNMNQIVNRYHAYMREKAQFEALRRELRRALKTERKRVEKKIRILSEIAGAEGEAAEARRRGELILMNLHRITKGQTRVTVEDIEHGHNVEIPLKPHLSPAANAQAYFKAYGKLKEKVTRARAALHDLREQQTYLEETETDLEMAVTLRDLEEIREELAAQGLATKKTARTRTKEEPQPLVLCSTDGFRILVGKNHRQNDYVTFKIGRENDVWLHARGVPGAHVLIAADGREVSPAAIEEAAALAAYYSRGRNETRVPVDYTLRKYVKKPKGARPGFVIYTNEKTITVAPSGPGTPLQEK